MAQFLPQHSTDHELSSSSPPGAAKGPGAGANASACSEGSEGWGGEVGILESVKFGALGTLECRVWRCLEFSDSGGTEN